MEISNQALKQIGIAQRMICLWILIVIALIILSKVCFPSLIYVSYIGPIIVVYNVWKMCSGLGYGSAMSVILCVLSLLPFIGIITLIALNIKATAILKMAGLRVGLLGVSKTELDKLN